MLGVIKSAEPRFLVLPSIFIYNRYQQDIAKTIILEPILGKYHMKLCEPINGQIHNVVNIRNKIYLFGKKSHSENVDEINIFTILDDEINFVKKNILDRVHYMLDNEKIQWPIYYDVAYSDKCLTYMIDDHLESKQFVKNINPLSLTVSEKKIKLCNVLNFITCTGENNCVYSYRKKIYKSKYVEKNNYIQIPETDICKETNLLLSSSISGIKKLNKDFIYISSDNTIVNIHTKKEYNTDISYVNDIICSKIWVLEKCLRGMIHWEIFIIGDDDDFNNAKGMNINDIGYISFTLNSNHARDIHIFKRIVEDPFKSEERNRLAEWLYNQLGQILPVTITGLITDYCCLVEYYDYNLLIDYLNHSREE